MIDVEVSASKPYSMDRNLRIFYEAGILEDPLIQLLSRIKFMYVLTVDPEDAPDQAEYIELEFSSGIVLQ